MSNICYLSVEKRWKPSSPTLLQLLAASAEALRNHAAEFRSSRKDASCLTPHTMCWDPVCAADEVWCCSERYLSPWVIWRRRHKKQHSAIVGTFMEENEAKGKLYLFRRGGLRNCQGLWWSIPLINLQLFLLPFNFFNHMTMNGYFPVRFEEPEARGLCETYIKGVCNFLRKHLCVRVNRIVWKAT